MSTTPAKVIRPKTCILDKSLSRGKQEVRLQYTMRKCLGQQMLILILLSWSMSVSSGFPVSLCPLVFRDGTIRSVEIQYGHRLADKTPWAWLPGRKIASPTRFHKRCLLERFVINGRFVFQVGSRMLDVVVVRERSSKRETKMLNALLMIKSTLWKPCLGRKLTSWNTQTTTRKRTTSSRKIPWSIHSFQFQKTKVSLLVIFGISQQWEES